jgi:cell division protein FtsI/penicillin-binding protein 2
MRPNAYRLVASLFAAGILALGVLTGWWALVRQDALLNRADNPRRYINERFVVRGSLLDRNNYLLVQSGDSAGDLQRSYFFPHLSSVTGFDSPLLGRSGLEAGLDSYLSGENGTPTSHVWWNKLAYGQPPPGLDVRLSIDHEFQAQADHLLSKHAGAAVLLNARTGEILAMSSQPGFDANQISNGWDSQRILTSWNKLKETPNSPLLNRAAQGQYQPGPSLGAFLLAETINRGTLPDLPFSMNLQSLNCTTMPGENNPLDWGTVIRAGCSQPLLDLSKQFLPEQLDNLFARLGFYQAPELPIITAPEQSPSDAVGRADLAAIGMENLAVSPLQMAMAASALSAGGKVPKPVLAIAVNTPGQGWVILPTNQGEQVFTPSSAAAAAYYMAQPGEFFWQTTSQVEASTGPLTWFLGGTLPRWQGIPLAVAVILEEKNPELAEKIGQDLLRIAVK